MEDEVYLIEEWKPIREFPEYSVSTTGRVRNDHTGHIMALTMNQLGIIQVGLSSNRRYYKRAVAPLVAHAFIPRPMGPFDTPINLDGDRSNNMVTNLMWRPRWFAVRYHQQFKHPYDYSIPNRIIDLKTKEVTRNSFDCAMRYGLLEKDLVLSILNRTFVWPTYQQFRILDE